MYNSNPYYLALNTDGFLKHDDSVRLLELINSPPPLVPSRFL